VVDTVLEEIESYYDTVPRAASTVEEVGPFTLFVADPEVGWAFYARPRLGVDHAFTADDVRRLLARQDELGVPRALEWVDEVTPTLRSAVLDAGERAGRFPLLALAEETEVSEGVGTRVLAGNDPDLALSVGAVHAAFAGEDEVAERPVGRRAELIRDGQLIVVAAYVEDGRLFGAGSGAPRDTTAELMGIGVPPAHRMAGTGTALTRALVRACRGVGVRTVFLSAYNDAAASIYRRVGFRDVGTACIFGEDDG
jgi:ribosomal protein S18 acetylase RimI-like enzyme